MDSSPYLLVQTKSANIIGNYPTEEAAWADIAKSVRHYNGDVTTARGIQLRHELPHDSWELVAEGEEMARIALSRVPEPGPSKHAE